MKLPWKESLLIFLLIALSISISKLQIKDKYLRYISMHPSVRFMIIFLTAYLIFSLNIENEYSITTRIIVAALVAFVVQSFLAVNTTLVPIVPIVPVETTRNESVLLPTSRI